MKLSPPSTLLAAQLLTLSSSILGAPVLTSQDETLDHALHITHTDAVQQPFASPDRDADEDGQTSIPTRYTSTLLARRLLALSTHGDLITSFPSRENLTSRTPSSVASTPIGLPEYIAACEEPSGNPTILSLEVSTSTRNAAAGSNVSLGVSWWDEYIHLTGKEPWALANLPRLNVIGNLEEISGEEVGEKGIEQCFLASHRDSIAWLPGRKWAAHAGFWTRLVVQEAYWIGGFGDRNYIGWLDPEEWRKVKKEDWDKVRLPGEAQ